MQLGKFWGSTFMYIFDCKKKINDKKKVYHCKSWQRHGSWSTITFVSIRSVVLRPDGDSAAAGEHLWVGEGRGQRSPELHELPDGPAPFHHGDLGPTAAALWHPGDHLRLVHHHRPHHVLPVRTQGQEKTPPRHIKVGVGPRSPPNPTHTHVCTHTRCFSAPIPLCTCEMKVSPVVLLQQTSSFPPLATHFSATQWVPIPDVALSLHVALAVKEKKRNTQKEDLRWNGQEDTLSFHVVLKGTAVLRAEENITIQDSAG